MSDDKYLKPRLAQDTAEKLRELIFQHEPGAHIGSLNEVAQQLGVGIVTVQQAARILEHEGLLAVKRGPGGGYYGTRPDDAALERAFATYLRVHNIDYPEAFEMTILLDCDIFQAAAASQDNSLAGKISGLADQLERCVTGNDRIQFEVDLRETLLDIVERPLLQLLASVAWQLYLSKVSTEEASDATGLPEWKQGRQRILHAILAQDEELAFFEAHRYRRMMLGWLHSENRFNVKDSE